MRKQGQADSNRYSGGKVEPVNYGKAPPAVGAIGTALGNHVTERRQAATISRPMDREGFSQPVGPTAGGPNNGPGAHRTVLIKGSQGKV